MKRFLLIFLIISGGYLLFSAVTNVSFIGGKDNARAKVTDRIDTIEFDISSANVNIIPENREDLETVFEGKGEVSVEQNGNTITVEHKSPWFNWFSFFNTAKLTVYVPDNFNKEITIDVGSGNLDLSGVSSKSPLVLDKLHLDMSSGNIKLNHLTVNEFTHDGSSGNITIQSLKSEKSTIDLSSGNVKMMDFSGELEADVSSGKLDVQVADLKDEINIDVSSGTVSLDLPDKANFTLDGEVGSGNISYDFPLTIEEQDGGDVKGSHGTGEHKIEVEVSSGNVKVH